MATIATINAQGAAVERAVTLSRGLLTAVVIAAAVTAVAGASAQDGEKPVVFDETAPLALSWKDLEKGVSVEVFNNSPDAVTLTFSVTALRGEGARRVGSQYLAIEAAEPPAVPTQGLAALELESGASGAISIKRVAGAVLPSGSYRSILVAYDATQNPVARLPLAIAGATAAEEPRPEPLTDTLTITVYGNRYLFGWLDKPFDGWFSKRYPAPEDALLPLTTKAEELSLPKDEDDRFLGGIQGINGAVAVTYAATAGTLSGRRALDLNFENLERFGEYQGDLDTLPADKDAGKVTLKLVHSDFIWWPLAAVALGVLTGFLVSRLIGVGLPSRRLRDEVELLREDYDRALKTFADGKPPRRWRASNITTPVNKALAECEQKIREFGHTQIANIPEDDVKELRKKIADVRTCVNDFVAYAGDMEDLEKTIRALKTDRPDPLPPVSRSATPHAATELTSKLLVRKEFDSFEDFKQQREAVTKAIASAAIWQARENEISQAQADIDTVKEPDEELQGLAEALLGLYQGLWHHIDVDQAAAASYGNTLDELRGRIDAAITAVPKRERRRRTGTRQAGRSTADAFRDVLSSAASYLPSGMGPTAGAPGGGFVVAVREALFALAGAVLGAVFGAFTWLLSWLITAVARLSRWLWSRIDGLVDAHLGGWWTLGLLLFAFAIAIGTGLSTEYAGKAFGTSWWDYVKLFLWGVATKLVLDGVVKGLDAIGVPRLLRR